MIFANIGACPSIGLSWTYAEACVFYGFALKANKSPRAAGGAPLNSASACCLRHVGGRPNAHEQVQLFYMPTNWSYNMSQRIGFVDFNLDNFHADIYLKLLRGELAARGFSVAGATALQEEPSKSWAQKNDVPYYDDIEQLNAHVDFYAVLAPSNPETHEALCRLVFPHAKPTYVDKTFAPDSATAERIFALADQHGVAMQTSSALRYTNVQERIKQLDEPLLHMVAWGGGSSFGEYAIHPLELIISSMGAEVERLMRRGTGDHSQLLLDFSAGRTAIANVYTNANTPFAAALTTAKGSEYIAVDSSAIFRNTAAAMLDLFTQGKTAIDRRETLAIRQVLDAAERPETQSHFVDI